MNNWISDDTGLYLHILEDGEDIAMSLMPSDVRPRSEAASAHPQQQHHEGHKGARAMNSATPRLSSAEKGFGQTFRLNNMPGVEDGMAGAPAPAGQSPSRVPLMHSFDSRHRDRLRIGIGNSAGRSTPFNLALGDSRIVLPADIDDTSLLGALEGQLELKPKKGKKSRRGSAAGSGKLRRSSSSQQQPSTAPAVDEPYAYEAEEAFARLLVGMNTRTAPPPFQRTKIVQFLPRHVICNTLKCVLRIRQVQRSSHSAGEILSNAELGATESDVLHFLAGHEKLQFSLRGTGTRQEWPWTCSFDASSLGAFEYCTLR